MKVTHCPTEVSRPDLESREYAPRFRAAARIIGIVVATVGSLALAGWVSDNAGLKSIVPGLPTMKVNTALSLLLLALCLCLSGKSQDVLAKRLVSKLCGGCGLLVASISLLTLGEYLCNWDLGIDQLLFHDPQSSGRMAFATALNLSLASCALLLLGLETRLGNLVAQVLALLVSFLSFVAIITYVFGVHSLSHVGVYSSMAVHTAVCLGLLGVGTLFVNPERGIMAVISANRLGGTLARRFLPVVIVVPVIIGWIRLEGQRAGFYGTEFGLALFTTTNVIILTIVSWWFARGLNEADQDSRRAHEETLALNESLERRVIERTAELSEANQALRSSEEKFRAVAESAKEAFISADQEGKVVLWNKGAEKIFGYLPEEILGRPLVTILPERFHAAHLQGVKQFLSTGQTRVIGNTVELIGQNKDGREFPLELSLAAWESSEGKFFTGIIRDISEHKHAEKELKNRETELTRSNTELEQFAYVASHDLQEPLRTVASYSQLLAKRYKGKLDTDADEFVDFIVEGAVRMQRLIRELLDYARISTNENAFSAVSTQAILDHTLADLKLAIENSSATITSTALPTVFADEILLGRLFQNLIGNAIKYHGVKPPRIHIASQMIGDEWLFSVSDNGIGLDPQYRNKIFMMFQRLHGRGEFEGTGIGLTICKKIVERHNGKIWVESRPGEGSTFFFTLACGPGVHSDNPPPAASTENRVLASR